MRGTELAKSASNNESQILGEHMVVSRNYKLFSKVDSPLRLSSSRFAKFFFDRDRNLLRRKERCRD